LLPAKLTGVARTIAMAWAGTSATPPTDTRISSAARLKQKAATLTAKKRADCWPAWPSRASNVQWRFHTKLFVTATRKATSAASR
jgi:hypothetical protein